MTWQEEAERNQAKRSWLYRWHLQRNHETRVVSMILGKGPLYRLDNWMYKRLCKMVPNIDESDGFDWPLKAKVFGMLYVWVQGVDQWFVTRDWYDWRKHSKGKLSH